MARKRWDRIKDERRIIARERMEILLREAEGAHLRGETVYADRYVQLARRISMRYKVPLPAGAKVVLCKKCGSFVGGGGSRVRVRATGVARTCLKCGDIWRRPISGGRQHKRAAENRKASGGRRGSGVVRDGDGDA